MAAEEPVPNAASNTTDEIDPYGRVVDIGGDCYFLEDEQRSLKFGCKSHIEFKKTFDPKLYNESLQNIEYIFGKYLAFGRHQLETFNGTDKDILAQLLKTRITQLKESNEYSSAKIINSRMRTYVDNINAILAKLGEGKEVPNNVGNAETFTDSELYQFILELTWFMTHADKVPKQNRKLWNEMIKKMKELKLGAIAEQIRGLNKTKLQSPPTTANFFKNINTTTMKEARTLRQAVGNSDTDLRPKFESLLALLRMKGYLYPPETYNESMENKLNSRMLNMKAVKGASARHRKRPKARTGVARPSSAPASLPPLNEDNTNDEYEAEHEGPAPKRQTSKAASAAKPNTGPRVSSDDEIIDATGSNTSAATSSQSSTASAASSQSSTLVSAAPTSTSSTSSAVVAPASASGSQSAPLVVVDEAPPGVIGEQDGNSSGNVGEARLEGQQHGGNLTLTNQSDDLTTDTLYQLTSPLFDYIRVIFDPVYSILQQPAFESDITLITIIPLLHVCMNIKHPGIYRIENIDPEVKEFIDLMLGATKQLISTLSPKSKEQFLEQLKKLPRMHLTSLLGSSSNSNHYKDPSTFPSIQFLSLHKNFEINEEKKEELPDGFFDEECLYLSNTPETSTTNKLKGVFSSNSNKKIKLYTLDWNTIKASKPSLDLQNNKEINSDTLEINPEGLFNDSELFLKTIMIVHHIFPGRNTFTAIEQPKEEEPKEEEPKAEPKEEPKEEEPKAEPKEEPKEEPKAESTCKTKLIAEECKGTASERKKQYRKQTVVLHPDKHSTDGCEKEATDAFKDLQAMKSCTETNENTVVPSNTVVVPTINTVLNTPVVNTPLAITNNSVVEPTTNAPLALTANSVPSTNIVVVPNQVN